jgi:hypothetical protein
MGVVTTMTNSMQKCIDACTRCAQACNECFNARDCAAECRKWPACKGATNNPVPPTDGLRASESGGFFGVDK